MCLRATQLEEEISGRQSLSNCLLTRTKEDIEQKREKAEIKFGRKRSRNVSTNTK